MAQRRADTIAAIATPPGSGAIAVVRLSGPAALQIATEIAGRVPRERYAELCVFRAGDGEPIDEGLVLYFKGPRSYTGEDVVELQGHGGRAITDRLLARTFELGARAAEPGEFTLRAFLNDKLDLLQAEAVADLVASGSAEAARAALRSLDGEFSAAVARLQTRLTALRVKVEAWLDFPEEELPFTAAPEMIADVDVLLADLHALAANARRGSALRDGLSVVIAGPPNAGKSSLLNRLAGYDAAIVTAIPGTTRDPLREHLTLDGLPVTVIDTAGLRESFDPVELEGLRRAATEVKRADRVLWVSDIREPVDQVLAAARAAIEDAVPFTLLRNKADLTGDSAQVVERDGIPIVTLSALTGDGVPNLVEHLKELAGVRGEVAGAFSARRRHLAALGRAEEAVHRAREEIGTALELAAEELRAAQTALSELTGEVSSDDLLGEIFATFCIGK